MRVLPLANMHAQFSNREGVPDLELLLKAFNKLAAPSTPQGARDEVIERAAEGEKLSAKAVQEIIDKAQAEEPEAEIRMRAQRCTSRKRPSILPLADNRRIRGLA